jgi:hypothetical protein
MYSGRKENSPKLLCLGEYVFHRVDNFKYLGSNINRENGNGGNENTFNYGQ